MRKAVTMAIAAATAVLMLAGCGDAPAVADALPPDFPDDVFLPDDYRVDSTIAGDGFTVVTLRTPGDVEVVARAANSRMESAGWIRQMVAGGTDSRFYAFRNERSVASLAFDRHAGGGVLYTVQLSKAAR
jgi:hypothetical protein